MIDHTPEATTKPTLFQLARAWAAIGSQSLGGGPSTLLMMRSVLIEKRKWVSATTFRDCWSIGQASPGIHLIALAGLLGQQMAGIPGMVVSVVAMVLPAGLITMLFTAGLVEVTQYPIVQAMLRGIVPATGGMTLALAVFFGRSSARSGRIGVLDWLVVVASAVLVGIAQSPVLIILVGAATLIAFTVSRPKPDTAPLA